MKINRIHIALFFLFGIVSSCSNNHGNKLNEKSVNDTLATFIWHDEACDNKGIYDSKIYTEEQLKNTFDLWFTFSGIALETDGTVFEPERISTLSIDKLTKEYIVKKVLYNRTNIVQTPFWKEVRRIRIQELEDEYELKKITIEAYSNPKVLLNNRFSNYAMEYATILSSKDTLQILEAWKRLAEKSKSNEVYMKKFNEQFKSLNKIEYAKVELLTFGWWNSVNNNITHVNTDSTMENTFRKIFIKISESNCDDVD